MTTAAVATSPIATSTIRHTLAATHSPATHPSLPPLAFSLPLLLTFPLRVFLLTSLTVLYLLHFHTALSLWSFLLSFLFFTLTSAPATGHPNTIDHLFRLLPTFRTTTTTTPSQPARPKRSVSLRCSVGQWQCHVHHWLYCLCFYALSWTLFWLSLHPLATRGDSSGSGVGSGEGRWWYDVLAGWCMGGVCQGIKFDDWSHVLWRLEKEEQQERLLGTDVTKNGEEDEM